MEYKASLDTVTKIITLCVIILFIAIGQKNVRAILVGQGDMKIILINGGTILLLLAILIGSYIFATQSYTVDSTDLTINRPISNVKLKLEDIKEVKAIADTEMIASIRTFGNGGLFGYYGKYYDSKIGNMTLFTTQKKNKILIVTNQGQKIIITPDDKSIIEKLTVKP